MHIAVHPVFWWPALAASSATVLMLVVWVYRSVLVSQNGGWRWLAFGLRVAALVMALLAMVRPSLVFTEKRKQSASLVILVDHSRSMLVADAWDNLPRWKAMNQTLGRAEAPLTKLKEVLDVDEYRFDSKLAKVEDLKEPPDGRQTAIGDMVREAVKKASGRVAGVVLLSDGANTAGTPPLSVAQTLKDLSIPLYTVGFGQDSAPEASRDLALRSITAGPKVFEKNKLAVIAELDSRGFAGRKVNARLLFDGYQTEMRTIDLPADGRTKIEMTYVPTVPGEHKVTVEVGEPEPKTGGELLETNNTISTFVTVLKGGLRVQYLDGGLESYEPRFIRWALDKSPDIKVDFQWVRDDQALLGGATAATLFDRNLYDVILIRDVPRSRIPDAALERLRKAVEAGAGFAMLGGRQSFGPGGYAGSPVSVVLPVAIHPGDRPMDRPIAVRPTAQGLGHFVMRLGSEAETPKIWESLLPQDGASTFTDVKDQGRVLAESPERVPLIVAQDFAQGRSMAIAVDSTRYWYRQSEQGMRHHRRFWRQVILWLARKEQGGENRVWVEPAKRRIAAGEGLEVTAGAEDEQGNALVDVEVEAMVTPPDGNPVPIKFVPQGERVRATVWGTEKSGDYQISLTARRKGQELGPPVQAKFHVFEDDSELTAPAADLSLLAQLAEFTGGEYIPPERFPAFLDGLRHKDLHLEIERLTQYRLWDNAYFLLLFVSLLTAEWALRKWKGLV